MMVNRLLVHLNSDDASAGQYVRSLRKEAGELEAALVRRDSELMVRRHLSRFGDAIEALLLSRSISDDTRQRLDDLFVRMVMCDEHSVYELPALAKDAVMLEKAFPNIQRRSRFGDGVDSAA